MSEATAERICSNSPALDASAVDEDVDGVAESALLLGARDLLGETFDLLVVGQIADDNLDFTARLLDEIERLEVLLGPLWGKTAMSAVAARYRAVRPT